MLQAAVLKNKYFYWSALLQKRQIAVFFLIFIFSLVARYNEYKNFREFHSDKSRQLHGAYGVLTGKGVSFESYDLNTLQPQVKPIVDWPPAYSYLVASISFITGSDIYSASVILDLICLTSLWFILFWMTRLLNFSLIQKLLLFLLLGFSKSPWNFIYSPDLLATTLFICSSALCVAIVQLNKSKNVTPYIIALGASVFLMVFLKYSLLPACFAIGLSIISYSFFSKKNLHKLGVYLILACVVSIGILVLYNQLRSGQTSGMANRHPDLKNHFNFDNLLMFNPFIISSFFHLDVLYTRFNYNLIYYTALTGTALIFVWIAVTIAIRTRKQEADYFSHLVLMTSLCIIVFLSLLSIYYPKDAHGSYQWTYVTEPRYFAPAIFLIIIYLIKKFNLAISKLTTQFAISVFIAISVISAMLLSAYYWKIDNRAGSFESLYGKIFRANEFVENEKNEQTYFISLSNHKPTDSEATSLVATRGTKVAMSYYEYFPDSTISILFSKTKLLPQGRKFIIFLDQNTKVLDSINLTNRHTIEQNSEGEKFLVINN